MLNYTQVLLMVLVVKVKEVIPQLVLGNYSEAITLKLMESPRS